MTEPDELQRTANDELVVAARTDRDAFGRLPVESNAAYAGKGATRQDANKPIFWYQSPQGKGVIRVIHADLSVVDTDQPPQASGVQRFEPVQ